MKTNLCEQMEANLLCDGFFTFQGADGWQGGIRLNGLTAINWREADPDKYEVVFFHGEAMQPTNITLNRGNFYRLVNYLS